MRTRTHVGRESSVAFGRWVARVLAADDAHTHAHVFADEADAPLVPPPEGFVSRAAAAALYTLLGAGAVHTHTHARTHGGGGVDQQAFFDLLQRAGEEAGLLDLEDEALDECVPLSVVESVAAEHVEAFVRDLGALLV